MNNIKKDYSVILLYKVKMSETVDKIHANSESDLDSNEKSELI